jgi:hypothetical protein
MFQTYLLLITLLLFAPTAKQAKIEGAWQLKRGSEEIVKIYADGYFMFATFDKASKVFVKAAGGTYTLEGDNYTEIIEFDSQDSTRVGTSWRDGKIAKLTKNKLRFQIKAMEQWERIDESMTTLTGNWRITARADANGKLNPMQRSARKTLKILSGTRFQWVAINTDTKQFFGTGGGTYTAKEGKYVETLEFFSRDNNRVGAVLSFDFEVKESDWLHSGLSSKGDKINEVWSREK